MAKPILEATTSNGQRWADPSEDLLYMLFEDIIDGTEEFFIVERLNDFTGQTYCQVVFCGKSDPDEPCNCYAAHESPWWVVERREGSADEHLAANFAEHRAAHKVVNAWAHEHSPEALQEVEWTRLRFD